MNLKSAINLSRLFVLLVSGLFFVICVAASWNRWANFEYRTFDLAFYIQALWQLLHGRFLVSLLNVPMLGNHADPIVFLATPLYAIFPHPMLLPILQIAALASMAPIGWRIGQRLGLSEVGSALMASSLLLTPATGFVALHEFHPEALAAPFILLMIEARLRDSLRWHWIWFIATLACKENMALLLTAYCTMETATDRRHRMFYWNILPGIAALGWFLIFIKILAPFLNAGNVEFASLYHHLGNSQGDIIEKGFTAPHIALDALRNSLTGGNLVWAILLPFLGLPLLRPRWLIVAAPILFQHLLSWRSSEWSIHFHYAAPLIPLFWIASIEAIRKCPSWFPWLIMTASLVGQCLIGPVHEASWQEPLNNWKQPLIQSIAPDSSIVASMPYLAHLANRERLYSLHHILKGLKTLSGAEYQPPEEIETVVIDYGNRWTFDPVAGYYHPKMRTTDGRIIPSSDRLLHEFLRKERWDVDSINELTIYHHHHDSVKTQPISKEMGLELDAHTQLLNLEKSGIYFSNETPLTIRLVWLFHGERDWIPWMLLQFKSGDKTFNLTKGLCAPEATDDGLCHEEIWHVIRSPQLGPGNYTLEAVFFNNSQIAGSPYPAQNDSMIRTFPLGTITVK